MPGTGTLTITGTFSGLPIGSELVAQTLMNTSAVGAVQLISVTTTPTALIVPSTTSSGTPNTGQPMFALIVPNTSNVNSLRVSGAAGETVGMQLHPSNPTLLSLCTSAYSAFFLFTTSSTGMGAAGSSVVSATVVFI